MNRAESSLIVVNGKPGNPQFRWLSNHVKPRQTTFSAPSSQFVVKGPLSRISFFTLENLPSDFFSSWHSHQSRSRSQ
jgi:hypothetical protein